MYLFHFFRSFLPLRNPIGFGISDFVEVAIALLVVALLFGWAWSGGVFRKLANHSGWCTLLIGLLPILLRLLLLRHCPAPVPAGADDFSYILLGDTLAHFRLANPPHPLSEFFETVFVLQHPSYSSIYPLGQGIFLAFGRLVFGSFWAGVLISAGLFCASCYWMLRGWVDLRRLSPEWALLGGLLAVMMFGPLCQWTNSYWGGYVSATAGCLVFGALPRFQSGGVGAAVAFGAGLALQLLTRPFECILLLICALLFLGWVDGRRILSKHFLKVFVVTGAVALPAVLLTGTQDKAVTGSWTTLPYMLSRYEYGVPATFTFQPNAVPHHALTPQQELDYRAQAAIHGEGTDTVGGFFERLGFRVRYYRFFLFAPLYLAALVFFITARRRLDWWLVVTIALFALGTNVYPYFYPHYVAAEACLFVLIAVLGLERLGRWGRGQQLSRFILIACGAQFLFWYGLHLFASENLWNVFRYEPWNFINYGDPEGRIAVNAKLNASPGQQLVFVRYWPGHAFHEWVQNAADIDSSRVVWALDLGAQENRKLLSYFPHRNAWLLQPDAQPPRLTAYSTPASVFQACREGSVNSFQAGRPRIRLQKPERAVGVVGRQFSIFYWPKIARPDDTGCVDIGRVPHPFVLKDMMWRILDHDDKFAGNCGELTIDSNAAVRVAMIDDVPSFIGL